jgi:hypothetical protein
METVFIGLLFGAALGTNVPLGMWRRRLRRFSPAWFVAIHASIPALVAIRLAFVPVNWVIPPEIALAVAGQFAGARLFPLGSPRLSSGGAGAGADQ